MDVLLAAARTVVSLAAVLGLVWLLARVARRRGAGATAGAAGFAVLGRHALGRSAGVAVVRVGDQALVLGVTEHSVRLLAQTAIADVLPDAPAGRVGPDAAALPAAREVVLSPPDADFWPARRQLLPLGARRSVVATTHGAGQRATRSAARVPAAGGALAGSALSPATWATALDVLRDRTTRR